jgi:DNA-binding CsgD family transcriptional regulator
MIGKTSGKFKNSWFLEGTLANGKSWIIPIDKDPFIIGRNEDCNLYLSSNNISRNHAEIYFNGSSIMLRDLKSTNGTFINGKKISDAVLLNNGDKISFSNIEFKIMLKSQSAEEKTGTFAYKKDDPKNSFITQFDLSKREEEILYLIMQGKSTKKIAEILFISIGTAKNHVLNIFKKTDTHSKFELLTLYNDFLKTSEKK